MTSPKVASASVLDPQVCSVEIKPAQEPICSEITQACHATKDDFVAAVQGKQREAHAVAFAEKLFKASTPSRLATAEPKRDFISDLWSEVNGFASNWWNSKTSFAKVASAPIVPLSYVGAGVLTLGAGILSLNGCGGEDLDYKDAEKPQATPPPSETDVSCETAKRNLSTAVSDSAYKTQVEAIKFPEIDLTFKGIEVLNDSEGKPISKMQPNTPVAWSKQGDNLLILTANKLTGGAYGPATLFVYKIKSDKTLEANPVAVTDTITKGKAILFTQYNPTNMGSVEGGNLGVLFPKDEIVVIDPIKLEITTADWCDTKNAPKGNGGSGGAAGAAGAGGSAGNAGQAGQAGKSGAGAGGAAGSAGQAGKAGSAGSAGQAGQGGSGAAGSSGQAGKSGAGAGGVAGTGGVGGAGGASGAGQGGSK
ncbi:MAG: hypothetical protein JNK65_01895 [Deltaproteobacteria bacterium]|nr:hypothetical protein [Deltaproteobacteria bacterium]